MASNSLAGLRSLAKGLSESVLSLSFNIVGIAAGAIIASSFDVVRSISWALLLYPGILSVRGALGGLYAGRLSTALHVGDIRPRLFDNTATSGILLDSVNALTLISSVAMGSVALIVNLLFFNASLNDAFWIMLVIIATMAASIVLITPSTFLISVYSYRKGLDPDVVVYPIISTIADVIVTICYILVLRSTLLSYSWVLLGLLDLVFVLFVVHNIRKNVREREFVKTIREFIITLAVVSVIVNITGVALGRISDRIGSRPEVYAIYPALIDTVGDVGSIIGSTATTKLNLGTLTASMRSLGNHVHEVLYGWVGSIIMFTAYAGISAITYGPILFWSLARAVLLMNVMVIPVIVLISFLVGIITFRRGLDPDNFIIPFETSLADGLTTAFLFLALVWGYGV